MSSPLFFQAAITLMLTLAAGASRGDPQCELRAFHLTDTAEYPYFSAGGAISPSIAPLLGWAKRHGANEIILNPVALLPDPNGNEVIPALRTGAVAKEIAAYVDLIAYIRSQAGWKVSLRPIVLVTGTSSAMPGAWHGVIEPQDPETWYRNYAAFHGVFWEVARKASVDSYTLGAELGSMTVGNPLGSKDFQRGFLKNYLALLRQAREVLPVATQVEYDINFTDDYVPIAPGDWMSGGELATWMQVALHGRHRDRKRLRKIIALLDRVGIDNYRSLLTPEEPVPTDPSELKEVLENGADRLKLDLDFLMRSIADKVGFEKPYGIRETGFKSVTNGFLDPFQEAGTHSALNLAHQAAAMDAILSKFCPSQSALTSAFQSGVGVWDLSTVPHHHGPSDLGFSPVGKSPVERVFDAFFFAPIGRSGS